MTARLVARPAVLRHVPLDRHAVIEASAGTGKTFTLEHLVVELVLSADASLDQVLVVTFTEKATNELRVRVRAKLEQLLAGGGDEPDEAQRRAGDFWTLDEAARSKIARALHAFDAATIATIHAFCQRVLRENAFASGRLFDEQQVDGRDAFSRAMREALRREVARDPRRARWLQAALAAGWSMDRLEELLWKCLQARGELRPTFDADALDRALAAFPVDAARQPTAVVELQRGAAMAGGTAKAVVKRLVAIASAVESARETGGAPAFLTLAERDRDVDFAYLLGALGGAKARAGSMGDACSAALELARATPSLAAALAQTMLGGVREELARRKRAAGQYDFDDMLSLVDGALRGPRGDALVGAMRERWRYALVDEFQDTDETQWSIFRRAFFEPRADAPRSVVYLVGDPKQSIYRFRGADVDTYLRARDDVAGSGGARVALDRDFRSTAALVEAKNALFDQDAPEPFFTGDVAYEPVACGRPERTLLDPEGRPAAPVQVFRFERDAIPLAQLASLVAREIRVLTDRARPWRVCSAGAGSDGAGRPLEHHDVFVLTRTRPEGRVLGAALRAAGVPYAFYKEDGLFQTDEARELRALLAAIDDPSQLARRLAAWLTPFFGLSLEDMERARELPASHPYVARLRAWKALADARDFERLFESIVRDSGVVRREIFFADGERELTNYLHILELLLEHATRTRATLRDLVHALAGLIDQTRMPLDLEGNVQRLESERRAVQIMTIHKSKGLEAAVVFVAGGASQPPGDDVRVYHEGGRRLAWVGRTHGDVKERIADEEREEDQRLMYVALTRAAARLYLPCAVRDGAPAKLRGAYDVVNRRLVALLGQGHEAIAVEGEPPVVAAPTAPANDVHTDAWQPSMALLHQDDARGAEATLRDRHAGAVVTSYTRMKGARGGGAGARSGWVEEAEGRRAEKASEAVDAPGPATLRAARSSGVFIHEVLERAPLASFAGATFDAWRARADVCSLFDEAMGVHRVDPAQREHAERLVWAAYTTPVALPGGESIERLSAATRVVREMDFVFPVPASPPVYVRGSLDLAFEHRGRTYFVDWKTDALGSFEPAALGRHVQAHYEDQVQLYSMAVVKLLGAASREAFDARFGGLLYCFLRGLDADGRGVWSARPAWDELTRWEGALRERGAWSGGRAG